MKKHDRDEIQSALKEAFPQVDAELRRDLWPGMLRKFDVRRAAVPWYDWALLAILGGVIAIFPNLILVFVYHL